MSEFWLFSYVALPLLVIAMAFGAAYWHRHRDDGKQHRLHPGE
ncbi:hypothetical protein [Mesorhizobium xinjiangense]|nr:hypothetical protein [Mesorhizobium xinjiangense]